MAPMPRDPQESDPQHAARRIEQLEQALSRRTELLAQKQAELAAIQSSKAFRAARVSQKILDRLFPLHSKRRIMLKSVVRRLTNLLLARRNASKGLPTDQRYYEECTPFEEYQRFIAAMEPSAAELKAQAKQARADGPLVSIVVPVYNPPLEFLISMIESVQAQTYPHWELCLADGSTNAEVRSCLDTFAKADPRVRVHYLEKNEGIVGNSNAAIAMAKGQYVGLLDHDDTLAPFSLHSVVDAIAQNPQAELLYSDEDKLDFTGRRVEPHFKPDWSPETLRSRNYVCHFAVFAREFLAELGGFHAGYDGAQDHDLFLRAGEQATTIVHIPHVLYHWRMHRASTAANAGSKGYAHDAGKRAVAAHLARERIAASVHDGIVPGTYRVNYELTKSPKVSVIVPNKDHPEMLMRCVESVLNSSYPNFELLIVENGSEQPQTHAYYRQLANNPQIRILEWTKPFNYAAVNNFAANHATGEYLLFLNNDIEAVNPDWLDHLMRIVVQPGVGAVGGKLYYADDTIQHAGIVVGMGGVAGHSHLNFPRGVMGYMQRLSYPQNVSAVTGACLACPRHVFELVGGFDEGFVLAFNDVDLCLQILAKKYRIVWTPDSELYHFESKTRGYEDTPEKQRRFLREFNLFQLKWSGVLQQGDPYYNPNYRLDRPDFALKVG